MAAARSIISSPSTHRSRNVRHRVPRLSCKASASSSSPLTSAFTAARAEGRAAFLPFITAGYPSIKTTKDALRSLQRVGADVIELGVPYADPLADGPVIQKAAAAALEGGVTIFDVISLVEEMKDAGEALPPIVLFTYLNPILRVGSTNLFEKCQSAGISGLLVPDLPLEEAEPFIAEAKTFGMEIVLLTTPTTPKPRMEQIVQASGGFTYLVSVTGVTGARDNIESRVEGLIGDLKATCTKLANGDAVMPVALGFGVSGYEQAKRAVSWGADGVIVGSALVRALGGEDEGKSVDDMEKLALEIREALVL